MRKTERVGYVILVLACILAFPTTAVADQNITPSVDIQNGPHIDRVMYKSILGDTSVKAYALLSNEIDLLMGSIKLQDLTTLDSDPSIEVHTSFGDGYLFFDINCREAPLNWTGLRRAFAYAFDKTEVTASIYGDLVNPQDSIIPLASRFCIEEDLDSHYYASRADIGNQILDEVGFEIDSATGFRKDPNGNPMHIVIGYPPSSPDIYGACAQAGVDALASLHISAETNQEDFNTYISGIYCGCSHDIVVYGVRFGNMDLIGSGFWKKISDDLSDDCYFSNSTYDMYLADVLSKRSFYEVHDAAAKIQELIHYNVPRLVICPFLILQPYRTDRVTGLIEDCFRGASGVWSLCNMHNITGSPGGSVRIGFSNFPASFNIYKDIRNTKAFLENLWPTLFSIGPNMEFIPNIATSMTIERHADDPDVPDGHTRLTIDIVRNATWSDGVPLTADDVVFTHTYEIQSLLFGNPAALDLEGLVSATAPTPSKVVIEYNTESYWHPFNQAFRYIIPKHIFVPGGIGYEGWEEWNPVFDAQEPFVTCGPFIMDEFESTQFTMDLTLRRNPNYHYNASVLPETESETTQKTDGNPSYQTGLQYLTPSSIQLISMGISISSAIVIIDAVIRIIRYKQSENR